MMKDAPLCKSLGITPNMQVLAFFISREDFDYSKTELAKYTSVLTE